LSYFHQAVQQLIHHIRCAPENETRVSEVIDIPTSFALIDWLAKQPIYPKFYWQDRDAREEAAVLGACDSFIDPASAYQVISSSQRVWGGQSFDGHSGKNPHCMAAFFFLPRIELIRTDQTWVLAANLNQGRQQSIDLLTQLQWAVKPLPPIQNRVRSVTHCPDREQWGELVAQVLSGIEQASFEKVVLARESTYMLTEPVEAAQLLKMSRMQNHHSFHFLLAVDAQRSFVGSTPERLYRRTDQSLQTEALAGTIGRGETAAEDATLAEWLMHDTKNIRENQYVVDDIIERLRPLAESVHVTPEAQLLQLRRVQHLRRNIQAELKPDINGVHLLRTLQPTAAVAGLPRQPARSFIARYEPFPRGWYAGSIGYLSHRQAEFCVAIRSALVFGKQIKLYAGAGIVPGSVAADEWQELDRKMSTLLSLLTEHVEWE
jgi:menaquinone-specific isochorismate synthase